MIGSQHWPLLYTIKSLLRVNVRNSQCQKIEIRLAVDSIK